MSNLYFVGKINKSYFYQNWNFNRKIEFYIKNDVCLTQVFFDDNEFVWKYKLRIKEKLMKLLNCLCNNIEFGDLAKNLGNGLWEFRCDFTQGTLRIFFTIKNDKIIFFDSFIKKTQETPRTYLSKAKLTLKEINK